MVRLVVLFAGLVSGCVSQQPAPTKPVEQMTRDEWCAHAVEMLGNPWADDFQKLALYEAMRNRGCMGAQIQ